MRRTAFALLLAIVVIMVLVLQACTPSYSLLMAATFGEGDKGSYSRYNDDDVLIWRSRIHYTGDDGMDVVDGFGDCMTGATSTLIDLDDVYLFDAVTRQPLFVTPDDELVVLPRPFERFDLPGPVVESFEFDTARRQQQQQQQQQREPDDDIRVIDLTELDWDLGLPDGIPEELRGVLGPLAEQTLLPTAVGDGVDRQEFSRQVGRLVELVRRTGRRPAVGLDLALVPSMWHGSGSDDPTPVNADEVSSHLVEASNESEARGQDDRLVWVADFGLPAGADESSWPANLSDPGQDRQPRPSDDSDVTTQFGHGLMVASVAAQAAPNADVRMINLTEANGEGDEWITVETIDRNLRAQEDLRSKPGALNMSLGSYDCLLQDVPGYSGGVIAALEAVLEPYVALPDLLVVAAAGNDGTISPFYPAAFPGVLGVGASDSTVLNRDDCLVDGLEAWSGADATTDPTCQPTEGVAAPFSNSGLNEQTTEAGVDVLVDYPLYDDPIDYHYHRYEDGTAELDTGRVRISGTSLAAPLVAACSLPDGTRSC